MPRKPRPAALTLTTVEVRGTAAWAAPQPIDAMGWGEGGALWARLWDVDGSGGWGSWSAEGVYAAAEEGAPETPRDKSVSAPGGGRVATIDVDGERVIIHEGGRVVGALPSQGRVRREMAWSPDGEALAIATTAGYVELWEVASRTLRWQRFICARAWSVLWSRDGAALLCGANRRVRWLDPADGAQRAPYAHATPPTDLRLDPSGDLISYTGAGVTEDGDTLRWAAGEEAPRRYAAVTAAPTARGIVTALDDVTLHLLDGPPRLLHAPALPAERFFRTGVTAVAASADGAKIYAAKWTMRSRQLVRLDPEGAAPPVIVYQHKERHVLRLALSPCEATLAIGVAGRDVCLLDTTTDSVTASLSGLARFCAALAWSPDSRLLAGADVGKTLAVWSPADAAKPRWRVAGLNVYALAFSLDGRHLYVADHATLRVFGAEDGVEIGQAALPFNATALLAAPDGTLYVGGDDLHIYRFARLAGV